MSDELEALLYQALASPLGIVLVVSDFHLAQQRLYAARKGLGDPALNALAFRHSPQDPHTELWIVRNTAPTFLPERPTDEPT
jgi:hypothetical protein